MKRCFRLTRSNDIKRVRRSGKSYAHPLVVLYALNNETTATHAGVAAGVSVGNAVRRNRAKRILRAAVNELIPKMKTGYDLLFIARTPLPDSHLHQAREALLDLLKRAGLIELDNVH